MPLILTTEQQANATVQFLTPSGQSVPVANYPLWFTTNAAVARVLYTPGINTATVVAMASGTASVVVTADADVGPNYVQIQGNLAVQVVPAPATRVIITAGTITQKPGVL